MQLIVVSVVLAGFSLLLVKLGGGSVAERKLPRPNVGPETTVLDPAFRAEIVEMIAAGQKIDAIKRVRTETGLDLQGAKNLVDGLRG